MKNKKENKWIWVIVILATIIILIVAGISGIFILDKQIMENTTNSSLKVFTEKELYARLEAEFLCQLLNVSDAGETLSLLSDFPQLAEEHGYTLEEVEELREKYDKDKEFAEIALKEANKICSKKLEEEGITEFTPRSPSYHET